MTEDCVFFSSSHGTFTKIGHILGHNKLQRVKKEEIIQCLYSGHNEIKLETER